jgi:hypothetical protein
MAWSHRFTIEPSMDMFDRRLYLLSYADLIVYHQQPSEEELNFLQYAAQQGIEVRKMNQYGAITQDEYYWRSLKDVSLMPLRMSSKKIASERVESVYLSRDFGYRILVDGHHIELEQLDIPLSKLRAMRYWIDVFNFHKEESMFRWYSFYPAMPLMCIIREITSANVPIHWWYDDRWVSYESLLANRMDNTWNQMPEGTVVNLVAVEKCYLPEDFDPRQFVYWPKRNDYMHDIFTNLSESFVDAFYVAKIQHGYLPFDLYDCECYKDPVFLNRMIAMFQMWRDGAAVLDEKVMLDAFNMPHMPFLPKAPDELRASILDYLDYLVARITDIKAKGHYLGFVGF